MENPEIDESGRYPYEYEPILSRRSVLPAITLALGLIMLFVLSLWSVEHIRIAEACATTGGVWFSALWECRSK